MKNDNDGELRLRAAVLMAKISAFNAENQLRLSLGESPAYSEQAYFHAIEEALREKDENPKEEK